jgi:hypothetical protein
LHTPARREAYEIVHKASLPGLNDSGVAGSESQAPQDLGSTTRASLAGGPWLLLYRLHWLSLWPGFSHAAKAPCK